MIQDNDGAIAASRDNRPVQVRAYEHFVNYFSDQWAVREAFPFTPLGLSAAFERHLALLLLWGHLEYAESNALQAFHNASGWEIWSEVDPDTGELPEATSEAYGPLLDFMFSQLSKAESKDATKSKVSPYAPEITEPFTDGGACYWRVTEEGELVMDLSSVSVLTCAAGIAVESGNSTALDWWRIAKGFTAPFQDATNCENPSFKLSLKYPLDLYSTIRFIRYASADNGLCIPASIEVDYQRDITADLEPSSENASLQVGFPEFDETRFTVSWGGKECTLKQPLLFRFMVCLIKHKGRMVSVDTIKDFVWNGQIRDNQTFYKAKSRLVIVLRQAGMAQLADAIIHPVLGYYTISEEILNRSGHAPK